MAEPTDPKKTDNKDQKPAKDDTSTPKKSTAKADAAKPAGSSATAKSAATPAKTDQKTDTGGDKKDSKDASKDNAKAEPKDTTSSSATSTARKSSSVPESGSGKTSSSVPSDNGSGAGGGRTALWLIIIIALAAGGAFVARDVWLPMAQSYLAKIPGMGGQKSNAADGQSPVQVLSERVAALEAQLSSTAASDNAMSALKAEKDRVEAEMAQALDRISDLERRLKEVRALAQAVTSSSGGEVDLGPVMSRIDQLEDTGRKTSEQLADLATQVEEGLQDNAAGNSDGKASGLVLAIAQLRDVALSGQPYAAQLDAFRVLAGDNADLVAAASRLSGSADAGLPTADELSDQFSDVAGDIIVLARSADGDWLEQAAARMSSLVSIRRTDGQSGDPVEDAVAEIESRLAARDVPGAVQIASGLSDILNGEAKTILEGWLIEAKTRAGAERALDAIHTSALAGLGG